MLKKNTVAIQIDSCEKCPCAKLKTIKENNEKAMFCETERSCIKLRDGFGPCVIPDWCPKLKQNAPKRRRVIKFLD